MASNESGWANPFSSEIQAVNNAAADSQNSPSGGGGGYGGGSSGAFGHDDTTATSKEHSVVNENTTVNNTRDYTTTNTTSTDLNAQKNLQANVYDSVQAMIAANQRERDLYDQAVKNNEDVYRMQTLENQRNADDAWYKATQKGQSVSNVLRNDLGTAYGSTYNALEDGMNRYMDIVDQDILNNQRKTQNEIESDLFAKRSTLATDYNEALADNQQALMNLIAGFESDYNNLLGNTSVLHDTVNETTKSDSKADSTTNNKTENKNSGNEQDSTVESTTDTTNTINNNTTGSATSDNQISSYLSDLLDASGKGYDLNKIAQMFDLGDLSHAGSSSLGEYLTPQPLQRQLNYRSAKDTIRSNNERYGGLYV